MRRPDWIAQFGSYPHPWDNPIDGLLTFMYQTGFQLEHVDDLKIAYELTDEETEYIRSELTKRYAEDKKTGRRQYVCK